MRRCALLLLLVGCKQVFGLEAPAHEAGGTDAGTRDALPDNCIGRGLFTRCYDTGEEPMGTWEAQEAIDSSNAGMCDAIVPQVDGPELCVIERASVVIDTQVYLVGPRPVVIVSSSTIEITPQALLAAVGFSAGFDGAGARPSCGGTGQPSSFSAGAGGGGGGFGTAGGQGGVGKDTPSHAIGGPATTLVRIEGGCGGGAGGVGGSGTPAAGGFGGGAVYFVARDSITMNGWIIASGTGGKGGMTLDGGGGGGSGGLVGFDAPTIVFGSTAQIAANGGGGGGGGDNNKGGDGGTAMSPGEAGAGGAPGSDEAGRGGAGAYLEVGAQVGLDGGLAAGGGGGGGAGVVVLYGDTLDVKDAQVSPSPLTP